MTSNVVDGDGRVGDVDNLEVDGLALDEQRAYREKCTRWIRSALKSIEDIAFWYVMFASHRARKPLQHFFAVLSKHGPEGLSQKGGPTRDLPIVRLVCVYSEGIQHEFISLIDTFDEWSNQALIEAVRVVRPHASVSTALEDEEITFLRSLGMELLLHNYSAFTRRVSQMLQQLLGANCKKQIATQTQTHIKTHIRSISCRMTTHVQALHRFRLKLVRVEKPVA